jgi:caa3-type cytochrome oxidase assembly factor Caa3/CtaG
VTVASRRCAHRIKRRRVRPWRRDRWRGRTDAARRGRVVDAGRAPRHGGDLREGLANTRAADEPAFRRGGSRGVPWRTRCDCRRAGFTTGRPRRPAPVGPHDAAPTADDAGAPAALAGGARGADAARLPRAIRLAVATGLACRVGRTTADVIAHPAFGWISFALAFWAWHTPRLYELALRSHAWHHLEHACFFATAMVFWRPVILAWPARSPWPRWTMISYLLLADLQNTVLAAILTFSDRVIYPTYATLARAGVSPRSMINR